MYFDLVVVVVVVLSGTYAVGTMGHDSIAEIEPMLWSSIIFAFTFTMHRLYYFSITFSSMSFLTLINKQGPIRNRFLPLFFTYVILKKLFSKFSL